MVFKRSILGVFKFKKNRSLTNKTDASPAKNSSNELNDFSEYKVLECTVCGFIYDEYAGCPERGLAPGTRWEDVSDDWICPDCGVSKEDFDMIERGRLTAAQKKQLESAESPQQRVLVESTGPIVIVGSGMAAYQLAVEFRKLNTSTKVIIVTREAGEHYAKPRLSNALAQKYEPEELVSEPASSFAKNHNLTVRVHCSVEVIDRDKKTLRVQTGAAEELIGYQQLVLALGADQVMLPINGSGAGDILRVNDLDDYRSFRTALARKAQDNNAQARGTGVAIFGGGLIGCEFANDLIGSGYQVSMIDLAEKPLSALVPEQAGEYLLRKFEAAGIKWYGGNTLLSVDQAENGYRCELSQGDVIGADLVLSAVGLRPRIELAKLTNLSVNRGIEANAMLQTNDPDIYVLGDCAEIEGEVRPYILPIRYAVEALAHTLNGQASACVFPAMPIKVKTPVCPVTCMPPGKNSAGIWNYEESEEGVKALFKDEEQHILGYVLMGDRSRDRVEVYGHR